MSVTPPAHLLAALPQGGLPAIDVGEPGSYLIVLHLARALRISRPRVAELAPGWYVYAGSARGPGGVAARVAHHRKRHKRRHWHIDPVSSRADALTAVVYRSGCECELMARLLATGQFVVPVPCFGSSDCRDCAAHLAVWTGAP